MSKVENKIIRRRIVHSYLSAVFTTALVLLLVGMATLLLANSRKISNYFKENVKVSVLMLPEAGQDETVKLQKKIESIPGIRSTELITRERGEKEMEDMLGKDFMKVFETSPIPFSIEVTLEADYVSEDSLAMVAADIEKSRGVDEVSYQTSLVDALNTNLRKISMVMASFIVMLMFISFALISNTMRLTVFEHRFNIHTMRLVGATRGFIRRPFLWRAVVLGLVSGLLADLMLAGVVYYLNTQFAQLLSMLDTGLMAASAAGVVVTGVVICLVSTFFVVGRLVSMSHDEMYY